jgi:hypothetical protein
MSGYSNNRTRIAETFSREKNILGELLSAAYLAERLASAVIPTWKKPVSVECTCTSTQYMCMWPITHGVARGRVLGTRAGRNLELTH